MVALWAPTRLLRRSRRNGRRIGRRAESTGKTRMEGRSGPVPTVIVDSSSGGSEREVSTKSKKKKDRTRLTVAVLSQQYGWSRPPGNEYAYSPGGVLQSR